MDIHDYSERKRLSLRQIIDFTSDVNPLGPSGKAKNAIRKAIRYLEFPPDKNIRHLKHYICRHEKIDENNVIFGQGSSQLIHGILDTIKPNNVLLISPVSKRFNQIVANHDISVHMISADEDNAFSVDMQKLAERIKYTDMVILSNPQDMTGSSMPADSLLQLIDEIEKNGKVLIIDERYIDFTQEQSPVKAVTASRNTMLLRTFSAFYALSGLPLGYGIGSSEMVNKLTEIPTLASGNTLAYTAAIASLRDVGYRARTLRFLKEEKIYFLDKLKQIDSVEVLDMAASNFLLLKINKHIPELESLFLKQHIIIDVFSCESGNVYLKLPIKRHKQNARFLKTLKHIIF